MTVTVRRKPPDKPKEESLASRLLIPVPNAKSEALTVEPLP